LEGEWPPQPVRKGGGHEIAAKEAGARLDGDGQESLASEPREDGQVWKSIMGLCGNCVKEQKWHLCTSTGSSDIPIVWTNIGIGAKIIGLETWYSITIR
jgi:hypothetical protein